MAFESGLDDLQPAPFSRRSFIAGAAGAALSGGFAVATQPVRADTLIQTPQDGMTAGWVHIDTETGRIPAYRARPAGNGTHPIILVIQEIFGVHEHIQDVCRRFAKLGYFAIAPEMYYRQGSVAHLKDFGAILDVVRKVPDAQVMNDLDATLAWAGAHQGDLKHTAITGFCWGGRVVWMYAAHNPDLGAGIAWYGRLVGDTSELTPRHPVDVADKLHAPVLGLYGGADQGIPQETVDLMNQRIAGGPHEIIVYPDTPHAFHADYRASYRPRAANDGWQRLQSWLKQHLSG